MLEVAKKYAYYIVDTGARQRIEIALAKGTAGMLSRSVDPSRPQSWEFSGFSQNGEDGIIQFLRSHIRNPNRYFLEIGCSDGLENNSSWLILVDKLSGLIVDGNPRLLAKARRNIVAYSLGAECETLYLTRESVGRLGELAMHNDPDVLSLDIDGNDYYIAEALFAIGFRPKIVVVEYNSAFGPDQEITIEYDDRFSYASAHPSRLYYGVSISGWKKFFLKMGYQFITVDSNGVNAFFIDPGCFGPGFAESISGIAFAENKHQFRKFREPHSEQFKRICHKPFVAI